ncbi:Uncharacterised protein [Vibrio cholerae]|nr:Uncharacterised protein [Vibrio cholerae]
MISRRSQWLCTDSLIASRSLLAWQEGWYVSITNSTFFKIWALKRARISCSGT